MARRTIKGRELEVLREKHKRLLGEILNATGLTASGLASKASISASTFSRFLKDDAEHALAQNTLVSLRKFLREHCSLDFDLSDLALKPLPDPAEVRVAASEQRAAEATPSVQIEPMLPVIGIAQSRVGTKSHLVIKERGVALGLCPAPLRLRGIEGAYAVDIGDTLGITFLSRSRFYVDPTPIPSSGGERGLWIGVAVLESGEKVLGVFASHTHLAMWSLQNARVDVNFGDDVAYLVSAEGPLHTLEMVGGVVERHRVVTIDMM